MNIRRALLSIVLSLMPLAAMGQFFSFGADPSNLKWSSIKSDNFKLIYPRGTDSLARTYLFNLEKYRKIVNEPMLIDTKPIPVVLHPYSVMSNGCVSWTPKVVNLITSPDAYNGTAEPWVEQLATHELRHVAQTEQFTKGIFAPAYWLIGEQAAGLGVGLFASTKFLEGDAVLSETQFSEAGRGRNARFMMYQRALYLDGIKWGWDKSAFGSYRNKTINQYCLGYSIFSAQHMSSGNFNYSGEFFNDKAHLYDIKRIFQKKSNRKYPTKDSLVNFAYDFWSGLWRADAESRGEAIKSDRITHTGKYYCEYTDAVLLPGGDLIALKIGLQNAGELVKVGPDGDEKILCAHSTQTSKLSSVAGNRIYWTEADMHDPSSLESFSEIRYYDLDKKRSGTLTRGAKYFNPDVSEDGSTIVVAEYPSEGGSKLVLISSDTAERIATYPAPSGCQILEPLFYADGIIATIVGDEGVGLYRFDQERGWDTLVCQQRSEIRHLRRFENGICFACDLDGLLNIYSFNPETKGLEKLTNAFYGADCPSYDNESGTLYYSEFSRMGFHLAKIGRNELIREPADFSEPYLYPVAEMLSSMADYQSAVERKGDVSFFDEDKYPSRKYNKFLNSFHFHSWAPVYYNVDRIMDFSMDHYYDLASLGATAYSQNELGTVVTMLGYSYHGGFHSAHGKVTATIADFDVEASLDLNDRKGTVTSPDETDENGQPTVESSSRPFATASLTVDYPHSLYGGGWSSMLIPYASINVSNDLIKVQEKNGVAEYPGSCYVQTGMRYYKIRPVAKFAVFPRTGFSVTAAFKAPILDGGLYASTAALSTYCYVPGFTRSQGFKLTLSMQHQFIGDGLLLGDALVSMPRGYTGIQPTADYAKIGLDCGIPIWLGDVSLGKLLYLKRLDITPFADLALDRGLENACSNYGSFGSDFLFRFHALSIGFEVNAGFRYARTFNGRNYFGPLFGMSIK